MFNKNQPIIYYNAGITEDRTIGISRLGMLRYEDIFDIYSTEPVSFSIKQNDSSEIIRLEQALKISVIRFEGESISYSIYADEIETPSAILAHYVKWDMEKDKNILLSQKDCLSKKDFLSSYPSLTVKNIFINDREQFERLLEQIVAIDDIISDGIVLNKSDNPSFAWKDLNVLRNYNWGQICATWNTTKENSILEQEIMKFIERLEIIINMETEKINQCVAFYSPLNKQTLFR